MTEAEQAEQERRILAVIGDDEAPRQELLDRWYRYVSSKLALPIPATGIEDFRWEELYVLGRGSPEEYKALRKDRPSYRDVFEVCAIEAGGGSEWSMFEEDLTARVRRKNDGKWFVLGLSELKAVEKQSRAYQLLHDYAVWFVNSR